ncbi:MAG TPA: type III secretion system export apparatus subunit SctR, partial [Myxococcota bacterium]
MSKLWHDLKRSFHYSFGKTDENQRGTLRVARRVGWAAFFFFVVAIAPAVAEAKGHAGASTTVGGVDLLGNDSISNRPLILMTAMAGLALIPFVGMMVTSFVKIAVVLSITRQAIGTQQAPPTTVITGMAIILTVYVMQPVGLQIYNRVDHLIEIKRGGDVLAKENVDIIVDALKQSKEPIKAFLLKNSNEKDRQMFYRVAFRMRAVEDRADLHPDDMIIITPAFVISELTKAFQIGFIIFIPFLVIDMVVSNILMALGMQMLSPTTISLPFKILLFVLVDGWYLIT